MYPAGSSPALLYTTVVGPFQGAGWWPAGDLACRALSRRATSGAASRCSAASRLLSMVRRYAGGHEVPRAPGQRAGLPTGQVGRMQPAGADATGGDLEVRLYPLGAH